TDSCLAAGGVVERRGNGDGGGEVGSCDEIYRGHEPPWGPPRCLVGPDPSTLHDPPHLVDRDGNVGERITLHRRDVGEVSRRATSALFFLAQDGRRAYG